MLVFYLMSQREFHYFYCKHFTADKFPFANFPRRVFSSVPSFDDTLPLNKILLSILRDCEENRDSACVPFRSGDGWRKGCASAPILFARRSFSVHHHQFSSSSSERAPRTLTRPENLMPARNGIGAQREYLDSALCLIVRCQRSCYGGV